MRRTWSIIFIFAASIANGGTLELRPPCSSAEFESLTDRSVSVESSNFLNFAEQAVVGKKLEFTDGYNQELYELPDAFIEELHHRLSLTNPAYANATRDDFGLKIADEILSKGTLNGKPRDRKQGVDQIRLVMERAARELGSKIFDIPSEIELVGELARLNPQFAGWARLRNLPSDWRQNQESKIQAAKSLLADWEKETANRYIPRKAAESSARVNPTIEKVATQAMVGNAKYVASTDGKYWVAVSGQGSDVRPLLPRWTGHVDEFTSRMFELKMDSGRRARELASTVYSTDAAKTWVSPSYSTIAPSLSEAAPTSELQGMNIYFGGKLVKFAEVDTPSLRQKFIDAGAWGYHKTQQNSLPEILRDGLIPNIKQTAESAASPGLHLSTHLGVNFPVDGPVAIIRVPLSSKEYRPAGETVYHGHLVRDKPMSASEVQDKAEFSVDNGVTWFPMRREFIEAAQSRFLPTNRSLPSN